MTNCKVIDGKRLLPNRGIPTCLYEVTEKNHGTLRKDSKPILIERKSTAVESLHPSWR